MTLEEVKKAHIADIYCQCEGNATEAAKILDVSYRFLTGFLRENPEIKKLIRRDPRKYFKKPKEHDEADFSHFNVSPEERDYWNNKDYF